jgi:hypothetical protein
MSRQFRFQLLETGHYVTNEMLVFLKTDFHTGLGWLLTEVRHGMIVKPAKSFRISSG